MGTRAAKVKNIKDGVFDERILGRLVMEKRTWAARIGNTEYGVLDGRKVGPFGLEEGDLGR